MIFVLGGARSGKTRYAQSLALGLCAGSGERPWYVATSRVWDDDHRMRIERHRRDRGDAFHTVEAELDLAALPLAGKVVLVDCVTLWLSNFFSDENGDVDTCRRRAEGQIEGLLAQPTRELVVVSNELGMSVHPPTEAGRKFVDLQGFVNQHLAARATSVVSMVAGIPFFVKGSPPKLAP